VKPKYSLNKWILLTFFISLILIGSAVIYFAQWNVGYLILGWLAGCFIDPIKDAIASQCITYTEEGGIDYEAPVVQQDYRGIIATNSSSHSSIQPGFDPYAELEREALEHTVPIVPGATPPLTPPPQSNPAKTPRFAAIARKNLLEKTEKPIRNGRCVHCEYASPLLEQYPYDPRFHYRECQIPELRSLVDQVILCPQKLIEEHYEESEQ